jgi:hypothetical protein
MRAMRWRCAEEYCWEITQSTGVVMLHPIGFHCIGVWISAGLPSIYLCS